ncbi:MAG TPA: ECF-type sigma factor [Pirellulaceae bacterium]|nr:ECF-type sigma factor [Pirellulaceae bacterium]
MGEVTQLLDAAASGDQRAAAELLPLVYDELRRLAAQRLRHERDGHTLQATALVHQAYVRLVATSPDYAWNGSGHFFAAAAEAMRRILVDSARQKRSLKRGGDQQRHELVEELLQMHEPREDLLALDEALTRLAIVNAEAANLVQLRYFAGLSLADAATTMGLSLRSANRIWAYARAWLRREIEGSNTVDQII